MSVPPTKRRLVSPAVLVLVLLCLGFPFIAVSCDTPKGSVSVDYSGWDLIVGGEPDVSTTPAKSKPPRELRDLGGEGLPPQPLGILFVLFLVAASVLAARKTAQIRTATCAVLAAGATLSLLLAQLMVRDAIISALEDQELSAEMAHTRFGFWITLLLMFGLTGYHVTAYVRDRRQTAPIAGPSAHFPP